MKKKLIISFVVLQVIIWGLVLAFPYLNPPPQIDHYLLNFHIKHIGENLLLIVFFNSIIFSWIPNFFHKKEFLFFALCILFSIVTVIGFETILVEFYFPKKHDIGFRVHLMPARDLSIVLGIGIGFRALFDWFSQKENQEILISEKKAAELAVLRHQLSPHFLFNTLNNITEMMHQDVDKAEKYISNFTFLLREMLQKDAYKMIPLEDELNFIRNYVELQKIRLNKQHNLQFEIANTHPSISIEPFLLINFIENVFKHGLGNKNCELIIKINVQEKELHLHTENEIHFGMKDYSTGVGMKNVKKRLEICYPNKHQLQIYSKNGFFRVDLTVKLDNFN